MKFSIKPMVVDAIQWSGDRTDWDFVEGFINGEIMTDSGKLGLYIMANGEYQQTLKLYPTDWIVKRHNKFTVYTNEDFEEWFNPYVDNKPYENYMNHGT